MNILLTCVMVVLVVVVGVIAVAVCADGLGAACDHMYSRGVDGSRALRRLARRVRVAVASGASLAVLTLDVAARRLAHVYATPPHIPRLSMVSALRI